MGAAGPRAPVCINSAGVRSHGRCAGTDTGVGQGTRVAGPWDPSHSHTQCPGKEPGRAGKPRAPWAPTVGLSRGSRKGGQYQEWVLGTPLPCPGIQGSLAWVTLGMSHKGAGSRDPGAGDSSGGSVCPVPWEMHPDCAGLWVQGQHGGSACSPLCQIQLVPGAGMRMSILRCRCPYWDAGVHTGMQVLYQDMDSCSRVQLQNRVPGYGYPYWNMCTCIGMQHWKWNTSSHSKMQILSWDAGITPGCECQCWDMASGMQVPTPGCTELFWDAGTGPGCEYQYWDVGTDTGMQVPHQDART